MSYDDVLRLKTHEANKKKAELRRELGPAWRMKVIGEMMKNDVSKLTNKNTNSLQTPGSKQNSISDKFKEK